MEIIFVRISREVPEEILKGISKANPGETSETIPERIFRGTVEVISKSILEWFYERIPVEISKKKSCKIIWTNP